MGKDELIKQDLIKELEEFKDFGIYNDNERNKFKSYIELIKRIDSENAQLKQDLADHKKALELACYSIARGESECWDITPSDAEKYFLHQANEQREGK